VRVYKSPVVGDSVIEWTARGLRDASKLEVGSGRLREGMDVREDVRERRSHNLTILSHSQITQIKSHTKARLTHHKILQRLVYQVEPVMILDS
jgi:hypothetical protein